MFCSYCGAQIINPNQKYCHQCGKVIEKNIISKVPQSNPEKTQYTPRVASESSKGSMNLSAIQNVAIKEEGRPGTLSIKSFVFALVSIGIVIFSVILGGGVFLSFRIFGVRGPVFTIMRIIIWIIVIAIQFLGLMFSIQSRKNSKKAKNIEPYNILERLGRVFGIIGIVVNAIAIGASLLILIIVIILLQ